MINRLQSGYCIFLVFLMTLLSSAIKGQSLSETYLLAGDLYAKGLYEDAMTNYKRVVFFDSNFQFPQAQFYIAQSSYKLHDFKSAAYAFDRAYIYNPDLKEECIFGKVNALLQQKEFSIALSELIEIPDTVADSTLARKQYFIGVCLYGNGLYDSAFSYFNYCLKNDSDALKRLAVLQIKSRRISRIKPGTARTLSYILPGAGQFYAGDVKNGLNSFLLVGGFGYLLFYTSKTYGTISGIIGMAPWFQRYYIGGAKHAYLIAEERVAMKQGQVFSEINEIILKSIEKYR